MFLLRRVCTYTTAFVFDWGMLMCDGQGVLNTLIKECDSAGYKVFGCMVDSSKLVFEERVKMSCFYCGKYNHSWRCPPKIPAIDMKKMFSEYQFSAFVYVKKTLIGKDYASVRHESSVELHRALLECEKWLWNHNNSLAISFIGGSCKLCKNGCAPDKCANPYQSRSPVEALGINVEKSARKYGISVAFPPKDYMMRIGLLLW